MRYLIVAILLFTCVVAQADEIDDTLEYGEQNIRPRPKQAIAYYLKAIALMMQEERDNKFDYSAMPRHNAYLTEKYKMEKELKRPLTEDEKKAIIDEVKKWY